MLDEHLHSQIAPPVFDPKTLEDYSMQGITVDEQTLLRQRLSYQLLSYQLPLVDRDPGDETGAKGGS